MGLVQGDRAKQALLEYLIEESKPVLPAEARGLHWLLATPFRYFPLPGGSRFCGPADPGVFYGAEERHTACAESGYWRLRFWTDSEFLSRQAKSIPITLFEYHAATPRLLDLTREPLAADRHLWTHRADYSATQALAGVARQGGVEGIRYESVRDPGGVCVAFLVPQVFRHGAAPYRDNQQGWTLLIRPPHQIVWQRDLGDETWTFEFAG